MPDAPIRLQPIAGSDRLRGVDIARGIALLGILLVNVRFFFMPIAAGVGQVDGLPGVEPTVLDRLALSTVDAFCSAKFIGLFSLLFGFGLALQFDRVVAAGGSPAEFGARRLGTLLAFGLVHAFLVWYGDVLMVYAILGIPMLFLVRCRATTLGWTAVAITAVSLVLNGSLLALTWAAERFGFMPPAVADAPTDLRGFAAMMASQFDISSPTWIAAEIAAFRDGPFADAFLFRAVLVVILGVITAFSIGWHSLAMMLVGAWAFRSGLFAPEASDRRRKIARLCLAVGLPISLAGVALRWMIGFDDLAGYAVGYGLVQLAACVLPLGYAAAIVEWGPRLPGFLAVPLERTGRMAITVYLAESFVMTALASWWGFGWFGSLGDFALLAVAVAGWVVLIVAANLWLARFPIGPVEWLWRRLSYGSLARPAPAFR
jgi:uncharacterized protein